MSNLNGMTTKEKAAYIGVCILYPFMLLFGYLGKSLKLFGTKKRQITASVLSFVMILSVVPVSAMTVFAENRSNTMTIQSRATGEVGFSKPMVGIGMGILPDYSSGSVYLGQYPQNSSNANDKSPVKWSTVLKSTNNDNSDVGTDTPEFTTAGAITLISEKVLDKSKYTNYGNVNKKPWSTYNYSGYITYYSASELKKFENNFYNSAFNSVEKAAIPLAKVYSWGGSASTSYYYNTETVETYVYTPDSAERGISRLCDATEYAKSRGVTSTPNVSAHYWFRSPASGNEYQSATHIVQDRLLSKPAWVDKAKQKEYGVRPMTRLKDANIILASYVGQKSNDCIVNAQSPSAEYELTLLDTSRGFTANMSGKNEVIRTNMVVPVSYQNAKTGSNEYISYTLTDDKNNVLEYRRVKASDAASGSFNVSIPMSALTGYNYKLNVFNEQLTSGYAPDISSAMSTLNFSIPRSTIPVMRNNVIRLQKNGELLQGDIDITNASEVSNGSWKIYSDKDCTTEYPVQYIHLSLNQLVIAPIDRIIKTGKYYVTYTEKDKIPSNPVEIVVANYLLKKVNVSFYEGDTLLSKKLYTEDVDKILMTVEKEGYFQTDWYETTYSAHFSCREGYNMDTLVSFSTKVNDNEEYAINLKANIIKIDKPVVNSVNVSSEGYAKEKTVTINATIDRGVTVKPEYSFDNGATWGDSNTKTFTENTSGKALVRIDSKNISEAYAYEVTKVDNTAPTIELIGDVDSFSPTTLTINPTAGVSGVTKVEISKDGAEFSEIQNNNGYSYNVTENGTYTVRVTNGIGETITGTITFNSIDTVKPILELSSNGYVENTWKTDGNITFNLSNSANNTSAVSYKYSTGDGNWNDCTSVFTISNDCNATYSFKAISAAGVESDVKTFGVKRDTNAPENVIVSYKESAFKEFMNNVTFGLFFKETVTVTITATDATSGVKEFKYNLGDGEKTLTATNGSASFNIEPQFKGNISGIKAIDNAGNESTQKETEYFAVDKNIPVGLNVDTNGYTSDTWTKDDVTFTISGATADSGIAKYQYSADNGKTWFDMYVSEKTAATDKTPYNATKATLTLNNDVDGAKLLFRAISNSNNISAESNAVIVKIDKAAPTISAVGDNKVIKQNDTLTINATAGISKIAKVEISKDGGDFSVVANNNGYSYKVTENGRYTVKVTNGAGVIKTAEITYKNIDWAKPVVVINSNGYSENTWCNNGNITLGITNETANLGETKLEYKVGNGDWQKYTGNIVIADDCKETTYSFKATSAAGVESEVKTFGVKRDTVNPDGDITFNENSVKKLINNITFGLFFKENIKVDMPSSDETSLIAKTEYFMSDKTLTKDEISGFVNWTLGNSLNITATDKQKFIIYVRVTDNAGNNTVFGSDGTTFDLTAPEISGITDGATYYTTQKVIVTDDNLETLTLNDEDFESGATITGNTDATYKVVATDKVNYIITVTVTMKSIASLTTTIDNINENNVKSSDKDAIETVKANVAAVDIKNATDAEKAELKAITEKCEALLKKIDAVTAEIKRITDDVASYDKVTVKSADKQAIEKLVADINVLLATKNLTKSEFSSLEDVKTTANGLLKVIADTTAEIKRVTDLVNAYKLETVKSSYKADIEQLVKDIDALLETKLLTEDEIAALNGTSTKATNLLAKISGTSELIIQLINAIKVYSLDTVKSVDKAAIEQNISDIDALKLTENLTESEIAELNKTKEVAKELLTKIADANGVTESIDVTAVNDITSQNVKLNDKNALEKAKTALEAALNDFSGNYTPTEKNAIQLKLDTVNASLTTIANAEKTISAIMELPTASNVKSSDKDAIYAAKAIYDELTGQEKKLVSAEHLEKLNQDINALTKLEKGSLPKTGETNNLVLWVALFIASGGAITAVGIIKKRKKITDK